MTTSRINTNIFCTFLHFTRNVILKLIFILFSIYISLISTTYIIHFLTWAPVTKIMNISDESVQKMHRIEIKINHITERFWHATIKLP